MRTAVIVVLSAVLLAAQSASLDVSGLARVGGRPQRDVVVWLDAPASTAPRARRAVLDQRNLQFMPRVLAVPVGATVELPNNDRVFHNVFSFKAGTRFDLGLYPAGTMKQVRFDTPGISRVFCNIHPQMAAYVVAVDSPFIGIADENGVFSLKDVPEGTYTYHAWRAGGTPLSGTTTIAAGTHLEVAWP